MLGVLSIFLSLLSISNALVSHPSSFQIPKSHYRGLVRQCSSQMRSSTSLNVNTDDIDVSTVTIPTKTAEEEQFDAMNAALCLERNLPLEKVKNARDLASPKNSPIKPGRVYRIGRVSDATEQDLEILFGQIGIKTLVDLRSPTELKDDPTLEREEVFADFTDMVFYENGDKVKELGPEEKRMQKKRKRDRVREVVSGAKKNTKDVVVGFVDNFFGGEEFDGEIKEEECIDCIEASKLIEESARRKNRKERHSRSRDKKRRRKEKRSKQFDPQTGYGLMATQGHVIYPQRRVPQTVEIPLLQANAYNNISLLRHQGELETDPYYLTGF